MSCKASFFYLLTGAMKTLKIIISGLLLIWNVAFLNTSSETVHDLCNFLRCCCFCFFFLFLYFSFICFICCFKKYLYWLWNVDVGDNINCINKVGFNVMFYCQNLSTLIKASVKQLLDLSLCKHYENTVVRSSFMQTLKQGSHSLEKSLNSIFPRKVLKLLCKSLKSRWIFFNLKCSGLESVFWCFLVVQDRIYIFIKNYRAVT